MHDAVVRLDVADRVAQLTIDRPEALNGISEEVLDGLEKAIADVRGDGNLVALVLRGAGEQAFSVGLDIDLLGRAFGDHEYFASVVDRFGAVLRDIESLPVPVIAAVGGLTRAGGFELALAADLVVVADEARIGDTHVTFGLLPGGGASARAPRRMGAQQAAALLLTGGWLDGRGAVTAGLALRSVPRAELSSAVEDLITPMREASPRAIAETKRLLREGIDVPLDAALDLELERFKEFLEREPSSREGYDAYVTKRAAVWPDREPDLTEPT